MADAKARSAKLYVKRQELEEQKQNLQTAAQQLANQSRGLDLALIRTDGEIELLTAMQKEANG